MAPSAAFVAAASMNSVLMLLLSLCSGASCLLVAIVQVGCGVAPDLDDVVHVTSGDEVGELDQLIFSLDLHEEVDNTSQLRCHLVHTIIPLLWSALGSMHPAGAGWAHHLLGYWVGACELPKLASLPC